LLDSLLQEKGVSDFRSGGYLMMTFHNVGGQGQKMRSYFYVT